MLGVTDASLVGWLLVMAIGAGPTGAVEPGCPAPMPGTNIVGGVGFDMDDVSDLPAGTKTASYGLVNQCSYDGTIVIAGPLSLTKGDNFYSYSVMIQRTLTVWADYINLERGGLLVGDQRYGVRFVWVDDRSSSAMAPNASANALRISGADFAWAGYGSGPSRQVAKQAFADDKLFFAGCASSPTVYAQNNQSFGTLPPVGKFLPNPLSAIKHAADAIDAASTPSRCGRGNNSDGCTASIKVGFIQAAATFTRGMCNTAEDSTLSLGMQVSSVGVLEVAKAPTIDSVKEALSQLIADGVNVIAGCTYEPTGRAIVTALEELDFSPLALILTTTVTQPSYADDVLKNSWWQGEYVIGPTPWHRNSPIVGEFSGKTSSWFFEEYKARFENSQVAYQGVSNFGLACALGAAIESAGTLEKRAVQRELYDLDLQEFYGRVDFTETGQVSFDMIVVQYAPNKDEEDIVYPLEATSGGTFLFPTPTWAQRRCWYTEKLWALERNNNETAYECDGAGTCNEEGACTCNEGYAGTHCEVNLIMTECPAGMYAIEMDPLVCQECPESSVSAPGSTSVEDCTPRLQVEWVPCEPCATLGEDGEDCGICPAGYVLSANGGQYEDYDECSVNQGGCDPLAEPVCTNLEGSYKCGECPSGFVGSGKLVDGGCTLPEPEMHGGELSGSPVVPTATIIATVNVVALDNATFLAERLETGLMETLNISSGVVVSNVHPTDATEAGRRLQADSTILVQFEMGLTGPSGPATMRLLQTKMEDPEFCTAMSFAQGQELLVSYTCPAGMVRFEGQTLCTKCPYPEFTQDQVTCEACPLNMEPDAIGSVCQCKENFYNVRHLDGSDRQLTCNARSYVPNDDEDSISTDLQCKSKDSLSCVSTCQGMDMVLEPGWTAKDIGNGQSAYFLCVGGETSCPGGSVANLTCGIGYAGLLCANCAEGYHSAAGNRCKPCSEQTIAGAVAILLGLVIVFVLAWKVKVWYNYFTIFAQIAELMAELNLQAISKQLMASLQILSGLGPVLDIVFPPVMAELLQNIASFFKIDVAELFGLGCFTVTSYPTSLLVNFGTVLLFVVFIYGVYWYQINALENSSDEEKEQQAREVFRRFDRGGDGTLSEDEVKQIVRQIDSSISDEAATKLFAVADAAGSKDGQIDFDEFMAAARSDKTEEFSLDDLIIAKQRFDIRASALGRFFLLVFVMYPGLTNKIFEGFMCRNLGDTWVLHTDYTFECYTSNWYLLASICGVLAILWPIGLPAFLYHRLRKDQTLIHEEDVDTLKFWDFAIGDYDVNHWYWECVELSRKMILSGMLGLLGRGSIKQVAVGVVVSFLFFAFALKEHPFESKPLNLVKFACEFQLFLILLSCLVIQTDLRRLTEDNVDDLGAFQLVTTFATIPLVAYVVVKEIKDAKAETAEQLLLAQDKAMTNPMYTSTLDNGDVDPED